MCLLIFTHDATSIPEEHYKTAFENNGDGAGFSYAKDGQIHIKKGYFTIGSFLEAIKEAGSHPAIIHFRWMTHGEKTRANCHPFYAGDSWSMGHNGVISNMKMLPKESDTAAFVRNEVIPYVKEWPDVPLMDDFKDYWKHIIGSSKLVFLRGNGQFSIVNEQMGHWSADKKTWYSNNSYEGRKYRGVSNTMTGAWSSTTYYPSNWTNKNKIKGKPVTWHEKKEFESACKTLGVEQVCDCSWCMRPLSSDDQKINGSSIFLTNDGEIVCEECIMDTVCHIPSNLSKDENDSEEMLEQEAGEWLTKLHKEADEELAKESKSEAQNELEEKRIIS